MAEPTRPIQRFVVFPCPVCGEDARDISVNAGFMVRGLFGTRTGTYPDPIPFEPGPSGMAAPAEPFPALDQYVVEPCAHRISPDEAAAIREQVRGY